MNASTSFDLGQLFSLHHRAVRANLLRWGVPEAEADDVCAEVFIVAMHRLPTFAGQSSISTWLIGIARNLASDLRRSARSRCEVLVDAAPEHGSDDGVHEHLERKQVSAAVRRAVSQLKPAQRAVVTSFVFEDQPMNVVALKQRVPAQTAYARLYAAQGALRESLAPLRAA
jgi:RNA polymerase sigma-70 factor (ECF subfamily)